MMTIGFLVQTLLLSLAVSMDSLTISIVCGLQKTLTLKRGFFMASMFGFFQGLMFFLGAISIGMFRSSIEGIATWISFALLLCIGIKMIMEGRAFTLRKKTFDITQNVVIFLLSLATSIDSFFVGMGMGLEYEAKQSLITAIITTLVTFSMSVFGWKMGEKMYFIRPRVALFLAGAVIIGIGLKNLLVFLYS